jgi:CheY-like chemotaxis protein
LPFSEIEDTSQTQALEGKILLVEDEPAVRALFAQALRQAGYAVLEACNGADALNVFERAERKVDLLLTDIRMPYIDGAQLASRLVELKPELRLLYISGYPPQGELGPNATLLQKPFVRADLLGAVKGALDRPAATV